jgi:glycerol-3-phosphate acyltransferase PlsY
MTPLVLILSYFLGAIPAAYLAGRLTRGIDIRSCGSGNVGTTNAFRVLGWKAGVVVLLVDVLKGAVAVLLALSYGSPTLATLAGISVMAGHNWPVFLRFRGGRGVATGAGVVLAMSPPVMLLALALFLLVIVLTRYVSLGSLVAAVSVPIMMFIFRQPLPYAVFSLIGASLVVYRHRPNIQRLLAGNEARWGEKNLN